MIYILHFKINMINGNETYVNEMVAFIAWCSVFIEDQNVVAFVVNELDKASIKHCVYHIG